MKLSDVKQALSHLDAIHFQLPNGEFVEKHFHVTEIGKVSKHFIDCGGTVRTEERVNFQLWLANDFEHQLAPQKLLNIIKLSEEKLDIGDLEIEVEYQSSTISKFGLSFDGKNFLLTNTHTDCLAKDKCGISDDKLPNANKQSCCSPSTGCC